MAVMRIYVGLDYFFLLLTFLRVLLSLVQRHFKICALLLVSIVLHYTLIFFAAYALCNDIPRGCFHHTHQARIYLKSNTKSPRGLYFNPAQFYLNGFASFDSTKETFEVLSNSRDSLSLTAIGRLEHEKGATDFVVRYVVAKC